MTALGAIFDLDGTLVDTYQVHLAAWRKLCDRDGVPLTDAQFRWSFGRRNESIIPELWKQAGKASPAGDELARLGHEKEVLFRKRLEASVPAMPGAEALLRSLSAAGLRLAIGTSAPPENVETCLHALGWKPLFEAVVTGVCVREGKPHPEAFLTAANRLGLPPRACVVFEDAAAGVEAAHRAGMPCIALVSEGHSEAELSQAEIVTDRLSRIDAGLVRALLERATVSLPGASAP